MFMNVCAMALMILLPSHSVPIGGNLCAPSGYTRAWHDLLHPTAIAENDTRYGLTIGGPKFGLTDAESQWISRVTGYVVCPGNKNGIGLKGSRGSGVLIGRDDLILTNAHVVRNDDGSSRSDWSRCYFQTQSQPPIRRALNFFSNRTKFGTRKPNDNRDLDYAIISLAEPISGVEPMPVAANVRDLSKTQELLMVTAVRNKVKSARVRRDGEPIIQSYNVREIVPSKNGRGMVISSDASTTEGSSGSVVMMRDQSGKLVAVGLNVVGAEAVLDGQRYDPTPNTGNQSFQLMFDGPLSKDLQDSLGLQSGI